MRAKERMSISWPYNLIQVVCKPDDFGGSLAYHIDDDRTNGVLYALSLLPEQEQSVLRYMYYNGMSDKDIADYYEKSRSWPKQVSDKALAKLRHPSRMVYIQYGLNGAQYFLKRQAELVKTGLLTPIEDLKLSLRSYNCLKKVSLNYVEEILNLSNSDISKIKNFGLQNRRELYTAIRRLGFNSFRSGEPFETYIVTRCASRADIKVFIS